MEIQQQFNKSVWRQNIHLTHPFYAVVTWLNVSVLNDENLKEVEIAMTQVL